MFQREKLMKTKENGKKHIQDVESLARKSLCKGDSRNVSFGKSAGTIFRFLFYNLVFKNTKIRYIFVTIRKNIPDN